MSFDDPIHASIYGGPYATRLIEERVRAHGLRWPVHVRVAPEMETACADADGWTFQPGDGYRYVTVNEPTPDVVWTQVSDPGEWVTGFQVCLLDLRRELTEGHGEAPPTAERPDDLRRLAVLQVRFGHPDWRATAHRWATEVLVHTRRKIHDTQLTYLDMLTEMASALDTIGDAGNRFHFALYRILETFAADLLRDVFMEAVSVLHERFATRQSSIDAGLRRAIAVIADNLSEPLSLDSVSKAAGMAPATLSRKFTAQLGQSFTAFVQNRRLELAGNLLAETDHTVLDIALSSGFGSVEQFHRAFKKRFSTTPAAFRRLKQR